MLGCCVSWVGRNVSSLGAEVLEGSGSRDGERQISSNSDRCWHGDREQGVQGVGWGGDSFPRSALTNGHRLGWLKQHRFSSCNVLEAGAYHQFHWAKVKVSTRLGLSGGRGENLVPCLWLLVSRVLALPFSRLLPPPSGRPSSTPCPCFWPHTFGPWAPWLPLVRTFWRPVWLPGPRRRIRIIFPSQDPYLNHICKIPFTM